MRINNFALAMVIATANGGFLGAPWTKYDGCRKTYLHDIQYNKDVETLGKDCISPWFPYYDWSYYKVDTEMVDG